MFYKTLVIVSVSANIRQKKKRLRLKSSIQYFNNQLKPKPENASVSSSGRKRANEVHLSLFVFLVVDQKAIAGRENQTKLFNTMLTPWL